MNQTSKDSYNKSDFFVLRNQLDNIEAWQKQNSDIDKRFDVFEKR